MKTHTVLCVDDEPNILRALQRLLRHEKHQIITTTDGRQALDIIRREEIALILVDQRMPELDSVCLLEQVKEIAPDTVRIVLSGYTPATTIIDAINRGEVYRFITKPWDDLELKLIVKEAIERYELIHGQRILFENYALQDMNKRLARQYEERTHDLGYFQQILTEIPLPLIALDADGVVVFANRIALQLFGEEGDSVHEPAIVVPLPPELIQFVGEHRKVGAKHASLIPDAVTDFTINGHCFQVQCQPLEENEQIRGFLLTFLDGGFAPKREDF